MKQSWTLYILLLLVASCKPAKNNLQPSASYTYIKNETEDATINKMITPYKATLDSEMNKVIGYSEVAMLKEKGIETLLGNFVADLVLDFSKTVDSKTDFCVLNNGGLRNSLPIGDITIGNVFELMPFDNEIVIVSLDGKNTENIFNYIAEKGGVPVSGITLKLEKLNGNLVPTEIKIGNQNFSKDSTYQIATSDYLASGGDNMNFWSTGTIKPTSKKLRDAIIDFIRFKTAESKKLNPMLDGRISYIY